jgi:RNA polymerase sigma-70 factor (ECF subfamily)
MAKRHLWQPGSNLRAWLFTILHNQYVTEVRHSAREATAVDVSETASILTVPSNQMFRLQLHDLEIALAKLPDEQRSILLLIGLEGMSYDGAAEVLDIPVGTVRSRLWRARAQLRNLMEGNPPPTKINRRAVRHRAA